MKGHNLPLIPALPTGFPHQNTEHWGVLVMEPPGWRAERRAQREPKQRLKVVEGHARGARLGRSRADGG